MSNVRIVKLLDPINNTVITSGLVPKGAYAAGTDYAVGDSVDYNGSSYVMFNNGPAGTLPTDTAYWQVLAEKGEDGGEVRQLISTVEDIDATTTGTTDLLTVPTGKELVITFISIRTTAFTAGSKSTQAIAHVGKTGPNYTDYYDASNNFDQQFDAVNQVFNIIPINAMYSGQVSLPIYQAADVVKLNVATASNATTETWAVDVFGYYIGETGVVGIPGPQGDSGGVFEGLSKITVSATEPVGASEGDLWVDIS